MSEQIEQPVEEPAPPPAPVAQEQAAPEPEAAAPVEDDALEPELAAQVIDIPDGDKLVPLSALTKTRAALKAAKEGSRDAESLKQQIAALEAQVQQSQPMVQAAQAILAAQQPQPQAPAAPVEDTAELEEIAKDFDFYKADGSLDLDRSRRYQAREAKRAEAIAQQQVQPLVQRNLQQQAAHNIARAKATVLPNTNEAADPQILDALVQRIAQQPNGMATLADTEAVKQLWLVALGQTRALQAFSGKAPAAKTPDPPPPPLFTEKAGGQANAPRALSTMEAKAAKDLGMSQAEYLKQAANMPW